MDGCHFGDGMDGLGKKKKKKEEEKKKKKNEGGLITLCKDS